MKTPRQKCRKLQQPPQRFQRSGVGPSLKYAGRVGTGFTEKEAEAFWSGLQSILVRASPIDEKMSRVMQKGVTWVSPILVVQIEYRELTADGVVRHATFKGLLGDKEAMGIRRPKASN
jgi:bifunctional non-homologous end joining protein LigD